MGVGASLYMYDVVVQKFTFAISSPDEFLLFLGPFKPTSNGRGQSNLTHFLNFEAHKILTGDDGHFKIGMLSFRGTTTSVCVTDYPQMRCV